MIQIDMEMPATCYDCPFCYDCCSCCLVENSEFDFEICDEQRMPYCPLQEVSDLNVGKWISVEDRMPPNDDTKVLTYGDPVTHWMPLPEPPKEEP